MRQLTAILAPATVLAPWAARAAGGPAAELKYALIVSRHGVRSPTWDTARLNEYSTQAWPDWGVAPGELTPHGRAGLKLLGAYYRAWLSKAGLFGVDGCRDAARIYIRSDGGQRTTETGRAFAESLLPGCEIPVGVEAAGKDPLFGGVGKANPELVAQAVRERLGSAPAVLTKYALAFDTLTEMLSGGATARRTVTGAAPEEAGDAGTADIPRPLATASMLSEVFLLEYAEGLPQPALGWGRLTKQKLLQIVELHTAYADLARRTPISRAPADRTSWRTYSPPWSRPPRANPSRVRWGSRAARSRSSPGTTPTSLAFRECWTSPGGFPDRSPMTHPRSRRWSFRCGARKPEASGLSNWSSSRPRSNRCVVWSP